MDCEINKCRHKGNYVYQLALYPDLKIIICAMHVGDFRKFAGKIMPNKD